VLKAAIVEFNPNSVEVEIGNEFSKEQQRPTPVTQNTTIPTVAYAKKMSRKMDENEFVESKKDEAELIILKAKNDAQMITDDAKRESERMQNEAQSKGYEKGYAEGYDTGASQAKQLKQEAESLLKEAGKKREEALAGLERQSVTLVIDIIDKLLGEAAKLNPQIVLHMVRTGLRGLPSDTSVKIRVNPSDAKIVEENIDRLGLSARPEIVTDISMDVGGCIIETSGGNIQSGLRDQWQSMRADLVYLMGSASADGDSVASASADGDSVAHASADKDSVVPDTDEDIIAHEDMAVL
jgi:flagellar assembly protein FliH